MSREEAREVVHQADVNGDGKVDMKGVKLYLIYNLSKRFVE